MKKRVFTTYWFYFFGGIFTICLTLSLTIFMLCELIFTPIPVTDYNSLYWGLPLVLAITIFMICAAGYWMLQFTILTEDGIKVRCVWCTIRKLKWEEVKEVRLERFDISVPGAFKSKWYVFYDGVKRFIRNGVAHKHTHITLSYSKRAKRAVEEFWKGEIKENLIK